MTPQEYNDSWDLLMELIETIRALTVQWPGYFNDPVDCDKDGCFV